MIMKTRPMVLISALSFAEIFAVLIFPKAFSLILTTAIVAAVVISFFLLKKQKYLLCGIFAFFIIFSALNPYFRYLSSEKHAEGFVRNFREKNDAVYTAVVDDCKTYSSYTQIFVTIVSVDDKPINFKAKARLGCYSVESLEKNDTITFSGTPYHYSEVQEDDFDTSTYLRSKEIFIDFPTVSVISASGSGKDSIFKKLREHTERVFFRFIPENGNFDASYIGFAMFAGDKSFLPSEMREHFTRSGLTHILCVSGLHLAILSGSIYFLLTLLSVHKKTKCILIILLCFFYTAFTGFPLSTIRACIMCSLYYIGLMSGKQIDKYVSLFLSLLVICTVSPYSVLDISLLLSFTATLGIICMSDFVPKHTGTNKFMRLIYGILGLLYFNFGAVFFTLPLCSLFFRDFSVMSVVSTLIVSYAVGMLLTLLLVLLILSPLSFIGFMESFMFGLGSICRATAILILKVASFFSHFRYALCHAFHPEIHVLIFVILAAILILFIVSEKKTARNICVALIIILGIFFSFISLHYSVYDDGNYKVFYYRKNENDRQISIKLGKEGYFIINADDALCFDSDDIPFDKFSSENYLFIIPDEKITPKFLAEDIKRFDDDFGIRKVFLPNNNAGLVLAENLSENGIEVHFLEENFTADKFSISYTSKDFFYITVTDGNTKTAILFGDEYQKDIFGIDCDICAFFTRKTKNQFDLSKDTIPECDMFFTRLKKNQTADGITNTFGKKKFTIKE